MKLTEIREMSGYGWRKIEYVTRLSSTKTLTHGIKTIYTII